MHVDETVLAPLRERYGEPVRLEWEGEISEREHSLATYNPNRAHDVTLFIFNGERLALIRKHGFEPGIWRPPAEASSLGRTSSPACSGRRWRRPGCGRAPALPRRRQAHFVYEPYDVPWRTHVFSATTEDDELGPQDTGEIEAARWGTLPSCQGRCASGSSPLAARSGATASRCMTRPRRPSAANPARVVTHSARFAP
jgi:hypothetical protein